MSKFGDWLKKRTHIVEPQNLQEFKEMLWQQRYNHHILESISAVLAGFFFINPDIVKVLPHWAEPWLSGYFFVSAFLLVLLTALSRCNELFQNLSELFYRIFVESTLFTVGLAIVLIEPLHLFAPNQPKIEFVILALAFVVAISLVLFTSLKWTRLLWITRFVITCIFLLGIGVALLFEFGEAPSVPYLQASLIAIVIAFIIAFFTPADHHNSNGS